MKKVINLILFAVLTGLVGCVSFSSLQTARTTPKNDFGFSLGVGTQDYMFSEKGNELIPGFDLAGRYGINKRMDIGLKVTIGGSPILDTKIQIIGNDSSKFAASIGFGLGWFFDKNFILPFYFSYYPNDKIGFYINPKIASDYHIFKFSYYKSNEIPFIEGASIGMRYGRKNAVFIEYSIYYDYSKKVMNQYAIGFALGIK